MYGSSVPLPRASVYQCDNWAKALDIAAEMTHTSNMKNETTMTQAEVVTNIYTVLEMLRASDLNDLADYWCNLLYTEEGDCWLPSWTEAKLRVMENDVIHYA